MTGVQTCALPIYELAARLARESQEWSELQTRITGQARDIEATIASAEAQRTQKASEIDAPTRATYDTLRRQKGGVAVASVLQRTCQACRVGLTPAIEQRARAGQDLITCQSCGRILYVHIS